MANEIHYILNKKIGAVTSSTIDMVIHQQNDGTEVHIIEPTGKEDVFYNRQNKNILIRKYSIDNKEILNVKFDYNSNIIKLSGIVNAEYTLDDLTLDNNASLFYLFSILYPQPQKEFTFTLLQSKDNRKVTMYLKNIGTEKITVNGESILTDKYEMGIKGLLISFFWPYKYYYWYSQQDRIFMKYYGMGYGNQLETVELGKYETHEGFERMKNL